MRPFSRSERGQGGLPGGWHRGEWSSGHMGHVSVAGGPAWLERNAAMSPVLMECQMPDVMPVA